MYLSVGVGDTDVIEIDLSDAADTWPSQGLHSPGAYTTDTYNGDMSLSEPLQRVFSVEPSNTAKAFFSDVFCGVDTVLKHEFLN